jgi:hypothetical protein
MLPAPKSFAPTASAYYLCPANEAAGFSGGFGGGPRRAARIKTPFILERANPSKDGDAKPWAFRERMKDEG